MTKLNTIWNITHTAKPLIYNDVQQSPP